MSERQKPSIIEKFTNTLQFGPVSQVPLVGERIAKNTPYVGALDEIAAAVYTQEQMLYTDTMVEFTEEELEKICFEIDAFGDSRTKRDENAENEDEREHLVHHGAYVLGFRNMMRKAGFPGTQAYPYGKEGDPSSRTVDKLGDAREDLVRGSSSQPSMDENETFLERYLGFILSNNGNDYRHFAKNLPLLVSTTYLPYLANTRKFKDKFEEVTHELVINQLIQFRTISYIHEQRIAAGKPGVKMMTIIPSPPFHNRNPLEMWSIGKNGHDKRIMTFPTTEHILNAGRIITGASVLATQEALRLFTEDFPEESSRFPILTVPTLHLGDPSYFDGSYHYNQNGHDAVTEAIAKRILIKNRDGSKETLWQRKQRLQPVEKPQIATAQ